MYNFFRCTLLLHLRLLCRRTIKVLLWGKKLQLDFARLLSIFNAKGEKVKGFKTTERIKSLACNSSLTHFLRGNVTWLSKNNFYRVLHHVCKQKRPREPAIKWGWEEEEGGKKQRRSHRRMRREKQVSFSLVLAENGIIIIVGLKLYNQPSGCSITAIATPIAPTTLY